MAESSGATRHVFFVLAAPALLIGSIDSTIVVVAVPNLTSALHVPLTAVGWTLTAYLLVQVVMLPVAGKLSDTLGRKRVFLFSLTIFTLGSVLCGLAPSVGWLIAFRALQAAGGGGLMPCAFGMVADQLSPLVWTMLGVSILFGALFVRHIRRAQNPVMDPQLLLKSPFVTANLYSFVFGAATFGFFSFIPYYAVTRYGMSTFESAAVLTPRALAMQRQAA